MGIKGGWNWEESEGEYDQNTLHKILKELAQCFNFFKIQSLYPGKCILLALQETSSIRLIHP